MELLAWWLALWTLRIVFAALFLAMGFGWAVAILTALGRFRYVSWR